MIKKLKQSDSQKRLNKRYDFNLKSLVFYAVEVTTIQRLCLVFRALDCLNNIDTQYPLVVSIKKGSQN